jgi:NADH-quinone oxidoreductase subunit M
LWLYRRVVFGDLIKVSLKSINDLDRRERLLFTPLILATVILGVYPNFILDVIGPSVSTLVESLETFQVNQLVDN